MLLTVAVASSLVLTTACGDGDGGGGGEATPRETTNSSTAPLPDDAGQKQDPAEAEGPDPDEADQLAAFCAEAERLPEEVPESWVGSADHIARLEALLAEAPEAIRPALETYSEFLSSGGVTDDPDSNLVENWPAEVDDAAVASREFIATNC